MDTAAIQELTKHQALIHLVTSNRVFVNGQETKPQWSRCETTMLGILRSGQWQHYREVMQPSEHEQPKRVLLLQLHRQRLGKKCPSEQKDISVSIPGTTRIYIPAGGSHQDTIRHLVSDSYRPVRRSCFCPQQQWCRRYSWYSCISRQKQEYYIQKQGAWIHQERSTKSVWRGKHERNAVILNPRRKRGKCLVYIFKGESPQNVTRW